MSNGSGAAMGQINYLTGLDQALYMKHEDTRHRHVYLQQVNWSGEYLSHKFSDGHANATEAKCEPGIFADQIFTSYLWYKIKAIKGVKSKRTSQAFPCDNNLRAQRVERKVMQSMAADSDEDSDDEDDDEADGGDKYRRSLSRYFREEYGCTGVRPRLAVEEDEPAESVKTSRSKTPTSQKYYAYYIPGWVYALSQQLSVILGTVKVDTVIDKFMYLIHDVSVCESKKMGLREMTGRLPSGLSPEEERDMLITMSSRDQEGWLPIPVWHTTITNKALHVCAMDWSPPEYQLNIAPWTAVIRRSSRTTKVVKADGTELSDNDLWVAMVCYHLYIDGAERDIIVDEEFDLLITRHDHRKQSSNFNQINIKWSGPTTMLYWIVVRESCVKDNDHFNWWGFFGEEPVKEATIYFGTNMRQTPMSGMFYRVIQAFEKQVATPEVCCYMYGFCFEQYNHKEITGSVNLLRYTEATIELQLQKFLKEHDRITVWVFRENLALLNHKDGSVMPVK